MRLNVVARLVGALLVLLGALMLVPASVCFLYDQVDMVAFLWSAAISISTGFLLGRTVPKDGAVGVREGIATVALGWVMAAAVCALPFVFSAAIPSYPGAYFEAMSGLTTTGASVIADLGVVSHGILFWRAFLHWLGGMGIIVLFIAVLPGLGVSASRLFKAEVPGPVPERLEPRMRDTARTLWTIYSGLTLLQTLTLVLGGMSLFDAVTHSFATIATGGFSTKALSVAHWPSPFIQLSITFFTALAGCNFALFYKMLKGNRRALFEDDEFRAYIAIIAVATLLVALDLSAHTRLAFGESLRHGVFQVTTIITTTGFSTTDFNTWPSFSKAVLIVLMFIGGCTGSTAGSIKVGRIVTASKHAWHQFQRTIHPRAVTHTRMNEMVVKPEVLNGIFAFVFVYLLVFCFGALFMAWLGFDLVSSATAVAATLGNVGPGLNLFGPLSSFAAVPASGKWVLSGCMLLGRLELFGVLLLFTPDFWSTR